MPIRESANSTAVVIRAAGADHHRVAAFELEPRDWCIETAGIGIGANQRPVFCPDHTVDRADRAAHVATIFDQVERGLLVRDGDVAAAPVRVGAAHVEIVRQRVRADVHGTIISLDAERIEPEAMDQR